MADFFLTIIENDASVLHYLLLNEQKGDFDVKDFVNVGTCLWRVHNAPQAAFLFK
jgi:hypothetical protein